VIQLRAPCWERIRRTSRATSSGLSSVMQ
jgi:hypothetical protein